MNTGALRKIFGQTRDERRTSPAIRVGYYFNTPQSNPDGKIQEEVGMIATRGTTGLNMKNDIKKLAECIGANACEMLNMDIELSRRIRRLLFWQRVQWFLLFIAVGAIATIIALSHQ